MTEAELLAECTRRAGVDEISPRDLVLSPRSAARAMGRAARVSAFVLTWGDAQIEHGSPDMSVEDFIRLRGHRRTTFNRRREYRTLFPDVAIEELAWRVAGDTAARRAGRCAPATAA